MLENQEKLNHQNHPTGKIIEFFLPLLCNYIIYFLKLLNLFI